jgi:phosphoribosylanthranilate isomerase
VGVEPDFIQLHGSESPSRVEQIRRSTGCRIIKAIKVETAVDAATALDYREAADLILFDAKAPKNAVLPGGNGISFDWRALAEVTPRLGTPWMLSGGLDPENVAEAIRLTGAPAVDVSSGVERAPGVKDPDLIRRFLRAVKTANQHA